MKRLPLILPALLIVCAGCLKIDKGNPYEGKTSHLSVQLGTEAEGLSLSGITVTALEQTSSASYSKSTNTSGSVDFTLPNGIYSLYTEAKIHDNTPYMASGNITVNHSKSVLEMKMQAGHIGNILIKEIYSGGCMKLPEEGSYNADSYIILHNNSDHTEYLDGLCFGTLDPYNSNATSVWPSNISYSPVIQAVWTFPGNGADHPIASGEDAVVVVYGAIDHASTYPLSVNLDKEGYYVCYNSTYFYNTSYHPAPGANIAKDHYLEVAIKLGKANAYTFSQNSPAVIIFRPQGISLKEFLSKDENVIQKPGSSDDRIVCVPNSWVEDGVEVFNGQSGVNKKRLNSIIDCSSITLSQTKAGRTVMRYKDENASLAAGYEILKDSNNSQYDFYERETQSLHE